MATTPVDVIKNLVAELIKSSKKITTSTTNGFSGDNAVDEAFKAIGITGGYSALLKEFEESKTGYSEKDFLEEVCSIRLNNADTGAITGSDAGGKTMKTVDSIIPENGAAKELTEEEYNTFTKNGLKVNISYRNDETLDKQKLVTRALYNWWLPEALDLIDESLGINFTDGRASINEVKINFVDYGYNPAMSLGVSYDVGRPSSFTLNINTAFLGNITDTDKNGTLTGTVGYNFLQSTFGDADYHRGYHTNYLDRLFLQAFTEMALDANISYIEKMNANVPKGLWKIVGGYDDYSTDYSDFYSSGNYRYGYNYAVLRYLAKNYSDSAVSGGDDEDTLPTGLSYNDEKTVLTASAAFTGDKIDLEDFQGGVRNVDASATTRGIEIVGNANGNSLRGGSGNDTLNGGVGNDTLTGGNGNDVFIYDGNGNDVITDYAAGEQIQVTNTIVARATLNGSDVVMRIGDNTLTLKNASGKSVTWTDVNNRTHTTLLGSSSTDTTPAEETPATLLTVSNSTSSPVTVDSAIRVIDATSRTSPVQITGNTSANTIRGGSGNDTLSGGSGNDSIFGAGGNDVLNGDAGNDTLTGGEGTDVFIYDAGNDIITDYATGEQIQLSDGTISNASLSGSDVVMTIGNNTLTVKNGKGKSVTWTDVNDNLHTTLLGSSSSSTTPAETPATLLTVTNSTSSPVTVDSAIRVINATSRTSPVQITGNTRANTIRGGSGNDTLSGGAGNDSIFGAAGNDVLNGDAGNDTLTGGDGNDTLTGGEGNDVFIYDAGNDVITDYATGEQIQLSDGTISNASLSGSDVVMTIGNNTLTVKNGKGKSVTWTDVNDNSHTTLLGSSSSSTTPAETPATLLTVTNSTSSPVTVGSAIRVINATSRTSPVQITGNTRANTIRGGSGNDTLSGGSGNDSIFGAAGNDVLNGDAGNDTLTGGDGNDTLTGGEGTDVFIYDAGNDVITDYATGEQIQLSDGTISNASLSGSDVVMTIGNNTLTVKNGKGKSVTWTDVNDNSHTTLLGSSSSSTTPAETPATLLTVTNSTSSPVTVDSAIRVINATSRTSPVQITGNTRANTIRGGSGNDTLSGGAGNDSIFGAAGNDVLNGDAGNDTLTGGEGTDVFIYDAGNDVITDYATGEQIQLSDGTISNASLSGSDVVMRIGNNTLTVKNGKGKSLTWVDTNDDSHTTLLSGSSSSTRGGSSSSTTTTGNRSSSGKLSNEAFFSGGALRNNSSSSSSSRSTSTRNSSSSGSSGNRSTGASLTSGTTQRSTENNNSKSQVEEIVAAAYSSINAIPADEVANNDADNVYTGGDKIVSNYAGDKIVFGEMYTGSTFDSSGNFFVGSSTGTLTIQDAMDKLVDIVDANGNDFIKAYQPSTAGVIDGRGLAGYEIINGSSTGSNVIFAGDGGSQLWGGSGSYADALVGGNGADIFSGGRFQGADNIFNASSADVVNLTDATLSDIVATVGNNSGIAIGFNTGNVVNIQSTDALSAAVNLADGSSWRYNHVTKGWQSA